MGARGGEGHSDERPPHKVALSRPFSVAEVPVTQALYRAVMGENPSFFVGRDRSDQRPVEQVSWLDAVRLCNELSLIDDLEPAYELSAMGDKTKVTWHRERDGYRLPTEAEWELSASAREGWRYSGAHELDHVAWHGEISNGETHPVKGKSPNAFGLYDCSGNVWEWVYDAWEADAYISRERHGEASDPISDRPTELAGVNERVARGGSWFGEGDQCRVTYRGYFDQDYKVSNLGLRLARNLKALSRPPEPSRPPLSVSPSPKPSERDTFEEALGVSLDFVPPES